MFHVYILWNKETDRYYIGSTSDLKRRLRQHLSGNTRTTRLLKTNILVCEEEFMTAKEARNREKKLKSYKSKKYVKWLISSKEEGY